MSVKTKIYHTRAKMVLSWVGITSDRILDLWEFIKPYFTGLVLIIIGMLIVIDTVLGVPEYQYLKETHKTIISFDRENVDVVGTPAAYASTEKDTIPVSEGKEMETIQNTSPGTVDIENEIEDVFGDDSKIALAIFKTESALKPRNMNWNCYYYDEKGKKYSDMCKPEDRNKAWSVDCGIAQVNVLGKTCPEYLFDYKENIKIAKNIFDKGGFGRWVTYTKGYYLGNL